MGVYIKDMEMPKSCRDCRFCAGQANTDYGVCAWCRVDGKVRDAYTRQDCSLISIPPHGRCIDADALTTSTAVPLDGKPYQYVHIDNIKTAPTIIEADESNMDSFIRIFEEDDEEDGMDSFIRILKD